MKYYHKYQKALQKAGYTVDSEGFVWDSMGNQSAGEDRFGNVQSKDANVTAICIKQDEAPLLAKITKAIKPKKPKAPEGKKRARTAKGHFVKDDPNTPENEAWVDE